MTYAEYLKGMLEAFPEYMENIDPRDPPYLCIMASKYTNDLYKEYPVAKTQKDLGGK